MPGVRNRGEKIRLFIMENIRKHPTDIAAVTAERFGISRQAVNAHIRKLINQKSIVRKGKTTATRYQLHPLIEDIMVLKLKGLEEDLVWRNIVRPKLGAVPENIINIWHYGFTEMLNNAIDHSQGKNVIISVKRYPVLSEISITDDGIGIFKRIQEKLNLHDERHAVLELSKGKLTTDPANHTGEGIFFSSRMFDEYAILSGGTYFSHEYNKPEDWIMERNIPKSGTTVFMRISNHSARKIKTIFDEFAGSGDYQFNKTIVPVSLARYGNESLVSRSQAKRLLARVDRFKIVIFDFSGVDEIGQSFADEVFRVFKNRHPEIQLYFVKANPDVERMIIRALSTRP